MGQLRNATAHDRRAFPAADYAAHGTVPLPQCTQAVLHAQDATTALFPDRLTDNFKFVGFALAGKVCHITASVGGNTGDFAITGNTDDQLFLAPSPGFGDPVEYHVTDGGALEDQQTAEEIMNESHAQGAAVMRKGGEVYIDGTVPQVNRACIITFSPD